MRSSRRAGGCVMPTDGKRRSGQGKLMTSRSGAPSACSARCTASRSLHNPSSVASPAAIPRTACRHVAASTTTRGHGRCAATRLPLFASAETKVMAQSIPCHPGIRASEYPGPRSGDALAFHVALGPGSRADALGRDDRYDRYRSHDLTPTILPRPGTRLPAVPADRCRRRAPGPGAQTAARRMPSPAPCCRWARRRRPRSVAASAHRRR